MDATDLDEAIGGFNKMAARIPMAGKGYEMVSKAVLEPVERHQINPKTMDSCINMAFKI